MLCWGGPSRDREVGQGLVPLAGQVTDTHQTQTQALHVLCHAGVWGAEDVAGDGRWAV